MDKIQRKAWKAILKQRENVSCSFELSKKYCEMYPENAFGWILYAESFWKNARYKEASKALIKARMLISNEYLEFIYHQYGHFYTEMGDYKKAEQWYRKAVREKSLSNNLVFLGANLAKQGKFTEAKKYHLESIEVNTQDPDEALYNLGLISRAEESYKEAKEYFGKAIEISPDYLVAIAALRDINILLKLQKKRKNTNRE